MNERDAVLQASEKYKITGDYCEVCHEIDGEQRYLVDGVTMCEECLIAMWQEFDDLQAEVVYLLEEAVSDPEGDAIDRAYDAKNN